MVCVESKLNGRSYKDMVNSVKEADNPPPRYVRDRFQSRLEISRSESKHIRSGSRSVSNVISFVNNQERRQDSFVALEVQLFKDAGSKGVHSLVDPNSPIVYEDKEEVYPELAKHEGSLNSNFSDLPNGVMASNNAKSLETDVVEDILNSNQSGLANGNMSWAAPTLSPFAWYLRLTIIEAQDLQIAPDLPPLTVPEIRVKAQLGFQSVWSRRGNMNNHRGAGGGGIGGGGKRWEGKMHFGLRF
ncbi:C2 calcium/lipid-binding plant phosphoribosyltransferase-like protein [Corchorus olitorius]|uniref:C2 calcium/lipid-binding plant phosphoribosyltransferase-like protein n=1 Tax=Corchorus olitorius TaxID=93759 RepID=A0A1R3KRR9_9ROSI|nr:C2 calcium/lipid-binding plant phosphoribosyltransferase-like protein [Corchorus olitorius]